MNICKKNLLILVATAFTTLVFPSEPVKFSYKGGSNYTMVERTDLRR